MARSKREALVDTALELFQREGFHATGIDRILAASGVAKKTLYHHFRSKQELILAALRLRDERFRNDFLRRVDARASSPGDALLALFDVLGEFASAPDFAGCAFINACAEYADPASPVHALAAEHKRLISAYVLERAEAAGARDPETLARQLCMLMDGAVVRAQVAGDANAATEAREAARVLIAEQS